MPQSPSPPARAPKRRKKANHPAVKMTSDSWEELHETAVSINSDDEDGTVHDRSLGDILASASEASDEEEGGSHRIPSDAGEEEYSQLQEPWANNEDVRIRTFFWEDQSYWGHFHRGMYRIWQFVLSSQGFLGGTAIVIATIVGMNVQLLQNGSLDIVNFTGGLVGLAVVVAVEILKFINLICSKKTIFELDYHGHAKKKVVFDDSHVVTKMHFFVVFLLMVFFCYTMLSLRNACIVESSNEEGEHCLFLDNLIERLGWGQHPAGGQNGTMPDGDDFGENTMVVHWDRSP